MSRMLTTGLALGLGLAGAATAASAQDDRRPCSHCGPVGTTRYYRTVYPVHDVTRFHDRSVYDRVTRIRYVVGVTRVQPIIHVNDVTRIHHHTIVSVRDVYAYQTPQWTPLPYVPQGMANSYGCSCASE